MNIAVTLPVPVGVPSGLDCTDIGVGAKPARASAALAACGSRDEMADVIEENFAADRKLAVGLVRHLGSGHAEGSVLIRCSVSIMMAGTAAAAKDAR